MEYRKMDYSWRSYFKKCIKSFGVVVENASTQPTVKSPVPQKIIDTKLYVHKI
jgi:hypothetical protein